LTTGHAPPDAVPEAVSGSDPPSPKGSPPPRLSAAALFCENCGVETRHRILRVDRSARVGSGKVRGVARCQECRWTHSFESAAPDRVTVPQVLSSGSTSVRSSVELPPRLTLHVGATLPGPEGPVRIQRLDTRDGRQVPSASASEVATVWAVRDVGATVPVSVVEGGRTRSTRITVPRTTRYTVGSQLTISDRRLEIVALRAEGRTWRRAGDTFEAGKVQRLYCRSIELEPSRPRSSRGFARRFARVKSGARDVAPRPRPRARATEVGSVGFRVPEKVPPLGRTGPAHPPE